MSISLRIAIRALWKTPVVTLASILTLALAIGANTAIFSVVYGVLARPLPFTSPATLVQFSAIGDGNGRRLNFSAPELADWQEQLAGGATIAQFATSQFTMMGRGDAEAIRGAVVSERFFTLLDAPFTVGRPLQPQDDRTPRVVLSDALWRRRFGARPDAVGGTVTLDGRPYEIVGVAPVGFRFPSAAIDVWTPLGFATSVAPPQWKMRGYRAFTMFGRLKPGVTLARVRDDASTTARSLAGRYPRFSGGVAVQVEDLQKQLTAPVRPALLMLFGAAGLVLLVACGNLASLSLVSIANRGHEIAVRSAIGASRVHLLAQFLTESALLSIAGTIAGLVLADRLVALLLRLGPSNMPRLADVTIDLPVLAFTIAMTAIVTMICGTLPAAVATRPAVEALKESRPVSPPRIRRIQRGLVTAEVALAVILLVGGALFARSFAALLRVDTGVRAANLVTFTLNLGASVSANTAEESATVDRLLDAVRAVSGVRTAAMTSSLPPHVSQMHTTVSTPALKSAGQPDASVEIVAASQGLFEALAVPMIQGRAFDSRDVEAGRRTIVLSEHAARRLFPSADAVGRRLAIGPSDPRLGDPEIVGVVADIRYAGLDAAPDGAVYVPYSQRMFRVIYLAAAIDGPAQSAIGSIRRTLAATAPSVAVSDVRTLDDLVADATAQPRFRTFSLVALAALALSMAAVGLYGVVAFSVLTRTAEIGVRMALGATRGAIVRMFMRDAGGLVIAGVCLGMAGSLMLTRVVATSLYGVKPTDPVSLAAAVIVAAVVAFIASVVPASRASRVDPLNALRT